MAIEPVELLHNAFPSLTEEQVFYFAGLCRVRNYPKDTVLCHEGAREHVFYLISEGMTIIYKALNAEEDLVLRYAGPGEFFGEMAIIQDSVRSASVRTIESTTVLEVDKEVLEQVLSQNAQLALAMIRISFERQRVNDINTIKELRQSFETLERLDNAKLDFIDVTAHELRTPLTVMRGYASILSLDPSVKDNEMLSEAVKGMLNGTARLHEIVNNMLDVQRIDMNQIKVAKTPVSLPILLRGLAIDLRDAFQSRAQNFELDLDETGDPIYIEADPGLINKALWNIVTNAIKYTPDGGTVRATLRYDEHDMDPTVAHLTISDTGIGIDPAHHKLIFAKFYRLGAIQLHSSGKTAFKAGGPGLGLAIAHGVITAHGGSIWVESAGYDETKFPGSTFHIILPSKQTAPKYNGGSLRDDSAFQRTEKV